MTDESWHSYIEDISKVAYLPKESPNLGSSTGNSTRCVNVEFISSWPNSVVLLKYICKGPMVHTLLLKVPSGGLRYLVAALAHFRGLPGRCLSPRHGKGKGSETI